MSQQLSREDLKELLHITLREYEWLRREIDQRIVARSQLINFIGAMAVLASAVGTILLTGKKQGLSGIFIGGIGAFFVLAVVYWRTSNKSIIRLGAYLQGLEGKINILTVELYGEVTVEWETRREGVRQQSSKWLIKLGGRVLALYRRGRLAHPTGFNHIGRP
ncbi:hypothetical protein ACFU6S_29470 [Streptomyces sp. NPDC057456]|uniref:hypothetical protein n=1 Tax=Streptomyces sp. NPDC057456 TaxID=3346139 RepID=UPI0036C4E97B